MSWQEGIAVFVILLGLGGAAFLVGQRPAFWVEFGTRIGIRLWPLVKAYVTKRMDADMEREWREAELRGEGDRWMRENWYRRKRKERG